MVANLVTAYNLYITVFATNLGQPWRLLPIVGSGLMIIIALLLVVAAGFIGYDGYRAYQRLRGQPTARPAAAPSPSV